jgi:hypothetical protein
VNVTPARVREESVLFRESARIKNILRKQKPA